MLIAQLGNFYLTGNDNYVNSIIDSLIENKVDIVVLTGNIFGSPNPSHDLLMIVCDVLVKLSSFSTVLVIPGPIEITNSEICLFSHLPVIPNVTYCIESKMYKISNILWRVFLHTYNPDLIKPVTVENNLVIGIFYHNFDNIPFERFAGIDAVMNGFGVYRQLYDDSLIKKKVYSGNLIQQTINEPTLTGYTLWSVKSFVVDSITFIDIENKYGGYQKVRIDKDGSIPVKLLSNPIYWDLILPSCLNPSDYYHIYTKPPRTITKYYSESVLACPTVTCPELNSIELDTKKTIKILKVAWENVGKFVGYNEIVFDNTLMGIIADNFTGKTTVICIIIYLLYNKWLKGPIDTIINTNHDTYYMAIDLTVDGIPVRIEKSRTHAPQVILIINGIKFFDTSINIIKYCHKLIGYYDDVLASIIKLQDYPEMLFITDTTSNRLNTLANLFGMRNIIKYRDSIKVVKVPKDIVIDKECHCVNCQSICKKYICDDHNKRLLDIINVKIQTTLESKRVQLTEMINNILIMMDISFRIVITDEWKMFTGGVAISTLSSSQQFILNIATRLAITKLSEVSIPSIIIIDEGFGVCDKKHLMILTRTLNELAQSEEWGPIFIISHIEQINQLIKVPIYINATINNESYINGYKTESFNNFKVIQNPNIVSADIIDHILESKNKASALLNFGSIIVQKHKAKKPTNIVLPSACGNFVKSENDLLFKCRACSKTYYIENYDRHVQSTSHQSAYIKWIKSNSV